MYQAEASPTACQSSLNTHRNICINKEANTQNREADLAGVEQINGVLDGFAGERQRACNCTHAIRQGQSDKSRVGVSYRSRQRQRQASDERKSHSEPAKRTNESTANNKQKQTCVKLEANCASNCKVPGALTLVE